MHIYKEIDDMFEYLLLGAGDVTMTFPTGSRYLTLHLYNVLRINKKIKDIEYILAKTEVDIH